MKILSSLLAGFGITFLALAVAVFYVVMLVTRVAWLCQKFEAFWKARRKQKGTAEPESALTNGINPHGI